MRIGGAVERPYANPDEWAALVSELGYRAVLSPVDFRASAEGLRVLRPRTRSNIRLTWDDSI
jgi:hypothetical protein